MGVWEQEWKQQRVWQNLGVWNGWDWGLGAHFSQFSKQMQHEVACIHMNSEWSATNHRFKPLSQGPASFTRRGEEPQVRWE